jgi:hypothetical protein
MKDLDKERELILKALTDINERLHTLELKFSIKDTENWETWLEINKLNVLG